MNKVEKHKIFTSFLQLDYQPVGVKLYNDLDMFNESNAVQRRNKVFYCHLVKKAAEGARRKADLSNFACQTSAKLLGLEAFYETEEGIDGWVESGLYANRDLARHQHHSVVPIRDHVVGIETSPLGEMEVDPDLVLIVCKPYQAMRLVQGYSYQFGFKKDFQMSGMCGVCFEATALPINNNEFSVSLLCSGTRFVSQWPEEMMMVSFPYAMAEKVAEGVIETAKKCDSKEMKDKIINRVSHEELTLDHGLTSDNAYYYK